jgi:hypothetical protein
VVPPTANPRFMNVLKCENRMRLVAHKLVSKRQLGLAFAFHPCKAKQR